MVDELELWLPVAAHELTGRMKVPGNFWQVLERGQWRDATGQVWDLLTMDESHLRNCVGFLQRKLADIDDAVKATCEKIALNPGLMQTIGAGLFTLSTDQGHYERAIILCKQALTDRDKIRSAQAEARLPLDTLPVVTGEAKADPLDG